MNLAMFLPEDIMLKIFLLVDEPVRLTHICRAWRTFTIDSPLLWTQIFVDHNTTRRDIFLTLSQSSLISVSYRTFYSHSDCDSCVQSLEAILVHAKRIQTLTLKDSTNSAVWHRVQDLFSKHGAPMLKFLTLYRSKLGESTVAPFSFLQDPPTLSVLDISNVNIRWTPTILRNLIKLKITSTSSNFLSAPNGPSLVEFTQVLQECYELRTLTIEHTEHVSAKTARKILNGQPELKINLPFLRNINLVTSYSVFKYLANTLQSPQCVYWVVTGIMEFWKSDYSELVSLFKGSTEGETPTAYRTINFNISFSELCLYISSLYIGSNTAPVKDSGLSLSLKRHSRARRSKASQVVASIIETVGSVSPVRRLEISMADKVLSDDRSDKFFELVWRSLLEHLPVLREIYVRLPSFCPMRTKGDMIEELSMVLESNLPPRDVAAADAADTVAPDQKVCPDLISLEIKNNCCMSMESLLRCFRIRNSHGMRLQSLRLTGKGHYDDGVSTEWMEDAKAVIDEVYASKIRRL